MQRCGYEDCVSSLESPQSHEYGRWSLKLQGLHQVETDRKKYYRGGIIPCTATMKRATEKLHAKRKELAPFQEFQLEWGKGIKFCEARAVRLVCNTYGVTEKATYLF
jgi:hypothetical protein